MKGTMRYCRVRFLSMSCGDKAEIVSVLPASMQSIQPTNSMPTVEYAADTPDFMLGIWKGVTLTVAFS